eukprot:UN06409
MKPPTILGSQFKKSYQIQFFTTSCNEKRYFMFFSFWLYQVGVFFNWSNLGTVFCIDI